MDYNGIGTGPVVRARHEGADALWILDTYETEHDAVLNEALIQAEFGLPDLTFVEGNNKGIATQEFLDYFWLLATPGQLSRADRCLAYHGRDITYPIWSVESTYSTLKRPVVIHATNLITGCEMLPYSGRKLAGKSNWRSVEVAREEYDGHVTSFTISDNHLYVADNLVTHNCQAIYGFRGADSRSWKTSPSSSA